MNEYKIARMIRGFKVLSSGDPKRIARRARNKVVGRALGRAGFWRWLWK